MSSSKAYYTAPSPKLIETNGRSPGRTYLSAGNSSVTNNNNNEDTMSSSRTANSMLMASTSKTTGLPQIPSPPRQQEQQQVTTPRQKPVRELNPKLYQPKPEPTSSSRQKQPQQQQQSARKYSLTDRHTKPSRMVVERLRHTKTKDIAEVVADGDFYHKGLAAPTTSRRRNHIDNQFDIKDKARMRDELLPDNDFVKRIFYTMTNRQMGAIDNDQFCEAARVIFGRVNGIDVDDIPEPADRAHFLLMQNIPNQKKMTLENFHIALIAAGYFLLMKPLFTIRKFATTKEFEHLAKNLGLEDTSKDAALKELDPKETGRFALEEFVWWAANRTGDGDFVLDLKPFKALSVSSPRKPNNGNDKNNNNNKSKAGRCAVSPKMQELLDQQEKKRLEQEERERQYMLDHGIAEGGDGDETEEFGSMMLTSASARLPPLKVRKALAKASMSSSLSSGVAVEKIHRHIRRGHNRHDHNTTPKRRYYPGQEEEEAEEAERQRQQQEHNHQNDTSEDSYVMTQPKMAPANASSASVEFSRVAGTTASPSAAQRDDDDDDKEKEEDEEDQNTFDSSKIREIERIKKELEDEEQMIQFAKSNIEPSDEGNKSAIAGHRQIRRGNKRGGTRNEPQALGVIDTKRTTTPQQQQPRRQSPASPQHPSSTNANKNNNNIKDSEQQHASPSPPKSKNNKNDSKNNSNNSNNNITGTTSTSTTGRLNSNQKQKQQQEQHRQNSFVTHPAPFPDELIREKNLYNTGTHNLKRTPSTTVQVKHNHQPTSGRYVRKGKLQEIL